MGIREAGFVSRFPRWLEGLGSRLASIRGLPPIALASIRVGSARVVEFAGGDRKEPGQIGELRGFHLVFQILSVIATKVSAIGGGASPGW